jgi:hypothetical protein
VNYNSGKLDELRSIGFGKHLAQVQLHCIPVLGGQHQRHHTNFVFELGVELKIRTAKSSSLLLAVQNLDLSTKIA